MGGIAEAQWQLQRHPIVQLYRTAFSEDFPRSPFCKPVDMEKHLEHDVSEETPRHEDVSTVTETSSLKRDLSSRHINMIAIAGMIVSPHVHILIGS